MVPPDHAERLLLDLGITEPDEIDVEVIACMVGAIVRYRPLACGDARILGVGDRAIITVDAGASPVRQRFSVAHELGHWHHHRGRQLACHAAGQRDPASPDDAEREADRYAASMLMPRFMMTAVIAERVMSMVLVHQVATQFRVSSLAAMLRLVDVHIDAFAVVVEEADGRRWFKRSQALDPRWFVWVAGAAERRAGDSRSCPAFDWYRGAGLAGCRVAYEMQPLADGCTMHLIGRPI
jgi:Zn-dependent peptidase ImmA (M78 family)